VTPQTRRRVLVAFVVLALTLPAETILLKALQSPDDASAARKWVASLNSVELIEASDRVNGYSFVYRREIMRALPAEQRAATWRNHFRKYAQAHPELTGTQRDVLAAAAEAATAQTISAPTAEQRASLTALADQMVSVLGQEAAEYLLVWMGPRETAFSASLEPLTLKLASMVRGSFTLLAQDPSCDCDLEFGCYGYYEHCMTEPYCNPDLNYPMCGWWWNDPCNGICGARY
jgi:hypothetical protein